MTVNRLADRLRGDATSCRWRGCSAGQDADLAAVLSEIIA